MLEIEQLHAGYGEARAVAGVTVTVGRGEIVALLGPNGAGKSTLLSAVAGLVRLRAGTVRLDGADLAHVHAHEIVARGLVLVPEGRRLFTGMTVEDNLELGAFTPRARRAATESRARVDALFPILRERRHQIVGALSGGQQQMVAVGRALMSAPHVLMLDEPSLGIAPRLVSAILDALVAIHRSGVGVLLVEQNVPAALAIAHRAYVMEGGQVVREGRARDLLEDPHVRRAYLGPLAR